jgi:hypothetical protein
MAELKQRILDVLQANEEVSFAQLSGLPGFAGDKDLLAPDFANLVIWRGLSPEAIKELEALENSEVIRFSRTDADRYALDGFVPTLPVAQRISKYRAPHWLPVMISLWDKAAED